MHGKSLLLMFLLDYACSHSHSERTTDWNRSNATMFQNAASQRISNVVLDCNSVQYYLASRQDPQGRTKACPSQTSPLFNGKLNITRPTRVLVHGWKNSRETSFTQIMTQAYLAVEDVNIIQVDWSKDAKLDYLTAAYRVPEVGATLAQLITAMVDRLRLDVNSLHLIGFSLGAHIAGIAGYQTEQKVARILGLDPAGPLFEILEPNGKLSTRSAQFVVTMHSCKYRLGTFQDLGHLNFNANSGLSQPGCWDSEKRDLLGFCSHDRAPIIFAAALIYSKGFPAVECGGYLELELGLCDHHSTTYFNGNFNSTLKGTYFFKTTSSFPFTTFGNVTLTNGERIAKGNLLLRMAAWAQESHYTGRKKSEQFGRMQNWK